VCSKKRPNFWYKDFILQHFKHCPLQSAQAQFSGCSSTSNAHSEMGQMAVCCQNLPLGVLSSHSLPSVLVGALFKKFGPFLNTGVQFLSLLTLEYKGCAINKWSV
jgi:hypothetical protein